MKKMNKILTTVLVIALAALTLVGCAKKDTSPVTTDGSTSMEKVIGTLGEAFKEKEGIDVTYNPVSYTHLFRGGGSVGDVDVNGSFGAAELPLGEGCIPVPRCSLCCGLTVLQIVCTPLIVKFIVIGIQTLVSIEGHDLSLIHIS